jgi:hypothetical protein
MTDIQQSRHITRYSLLSSENISSAAIGLQKIPGCVFREQVWNEGVSSIFLKSANLLQNVSGPSRVIGAIVRREG